MIRNLLGGTFWTRLLAPALFLFAAIPGLASPVLINSFSPASGPPGTTVTINGAGFNQNFSLFTISFNGVATGGYSLLSDSQIQVVVPPNATTGPIAIVAHLLAAQYNPVSAASFTITAPPPPGPKIISFTPGSGPVGSGVTISGENFTGTTVVRFNGVSAAFTVNSATQISATVPAGATTGPLSVTTPGGTATTVGGFSVVTAAPVISSFNPTSGSGNTAVTISGAYFSGASEVRFNGVSSGYFTVNSDTQITAYVPSTATTGPIKVVTPSGTGVSTANFTVIVVIPPPSISLVSPASSQPGAAVTLTGQNFGNTTSVTFNGVPASFTVPDGSHIQVTVPQAATTGPITVTTPGGTATTLGNFTVIPPSVPPTVGGFSPASGLAGITVVIQGSGFVGVTSVRFNGVTAPFTVDSATQISAQAPAGAGTGPIAVTTAVGTGTSSGNFTVNLPPPAPVVQFINPNSGLPGMTIKVEGVHFTGATLVTFNGAAATFRLLDDADISATVPAGATTGPVYVTTPGGTGSSGVNFTVLTPPNPPAIISFFPTSGQVGAVVTISGANFTGATTLSFGGVPTAFYVNSSSQIAAYVPFGAVSGVITVVTPNGADSSANAFVVVTPVTYAPQISGFMPASGFPGDTVQIQGSSLAAVSSVAFNGVPAAFSIVSDALISATVPQTATTGNLSVTSAQGGATSADIFTVLGTGSGPVITAMSVSNGVAGDSISLYGSGLSGATGVAFFDAVNGSAAANFSVISDGEIQTTVPATADTGYITVLAGGYSVATPAPFVIDGTLLPAITSFLPLAGHPGDLLRVLGTGMGAVTGVAIGGQDVPFQLVSGSELSLTVPPGGFGGFIRLSTPQGAIYSDAEFTALQAPLAHPDALAAAMVPDLSLPGFIQFTFPTEPNHGYRVQFSTSLNPNSWRVKRVIPPQSAGGMITVSDAIRPQGSAFYQVVTDSPALELRNWDFEYGLSQWTASGDAFTNQPAFGDCIPTASVAGAGGVLGGDYWNVPFPVGHHGSSWICTGINHMDDSPTPARLDASLDALIGSLTSREFRLSANFISFLIGGGRDIINLRVEFQILEPDPNLRRNLGGIWGTDGDFAIVSVFTGTDHEQLRREVWDATAYQGRMARIRILDNSVTRHISVDDFRFLTDDPTPGLSAMAWGDLVDPDAPVWGFSDTHTHPMVHLAYGGTLIAGQPDGPFETALASCESHHGDGGIGYLANPFVQETSVNNPLYALFETSMPGLFGPDVPLLQAAELFRNPAAAPLFVLFDATVDLGAGLFMSVNLGHRTSGAQSAYDGWPSFVSKSHEQMHVEFIRRAYQGGLRLMVAHAVNTELLGSTFGGLRPQPNDDPGQALVQIQAMTNFVAAHSDFMEIAHSPAEARAIIRGNRLAVILGIEEDSFGGFKDEAQCTDQQVADYVQQVYDMGVRHVFPIHVANNAFGGCGLYEDQWGLNNYYLHQNPVQVLPAPPTIQFRMGEDAPLNIGAISGLLFGYYPPDYNALFRDPLPETGYFPGHMNARGLTQRGTNFLHELMHRGMIIDVDHMGYVTRNAALSLAEAQNYPVIDGHCTFTEMAWRRGQTAATGKLAHEADTTPDLIERIRALGGMVGVITVAKDNQSWGDLVPNDSPGSAKSWAQQYLYAVEHLDGQNVSLATDFQLVNNSGPRFGVNTAFALNNAEQSQQDHLRAPLYGGFADAQVNGVAYDRPVSDYRAYRFQAVHGGNYYDGDDRDTWNALAIAASLPVTGETPDTAWQPGLFDAFLPFAPLVGPAGKISSRAWGFAGQVGDDDSRAAYLAYYGDPSGAVITDPAVLKIKKVADRWKAMAGTNAPLQRYTMPPVAIANDPGNHVITRDWDINLDGFAHYGMLPDFLQDLSNVGVNRDKMAPLFHSAEDYIRMWEKCLANRP